MCDIEALRRLREKFDFDIEKDRREFVEELENWIHTQVSQLNPAFKDVDKNHLFAEACRKSQFPDFKLILKKEEIDRLLTDALYGRNRFIWLAIRTGYRDEPDLDCSDSCKPVTRRTTALHHAARLHHGLVHEVLSIVHDLFQVYDKFEANYVDEDGLTHLHVACRFGCEDAVEKFLDLGADPNCRVASTGCTTLHLASRLPAVLGYNNQRRGKLVELLLEHGANPNLADERGRTALHWICEEPGDDWFLAQMLLVLCDERFRPVQLDARDKLGNTPLSLAMESENELLAKYLHNESAKLEKSCKGLERINRKNIKVQQLLHV